MTPYALMESIPYPVPWPSVFKAIISAALLIGILVLFLCRLGRAHRWLAIILAVLLLDQGTKAAWATVAPLLISISACRSLWMICSGLCRF